MPGNASRAGSSNLEMEDVSFEIESNFKGMRDRPLPGECNFSTGVTGVVDMDNPTSSNKFQQVSPSGFGKQRYHC